MSETYKPEYYEEFKDLSRSSARVVAPMVMELISPKRVVDVGCGLGQWLAAFQQAGVTEILGLDGNYVQRDRLEIPPCDFQVQDLALPFAIATKYDLAMCLEVAEHLPASHAVGLVESLTKLAPVVLFSAAIPHQPGKDHFNCQWPEYWAELFGRQGYVVVDALRHQVWDHPQVAWWYQQNIMFFVAEEVLSKYEDLESFRRVGFNRPLRLVHPYLLSLWSGEFTSQNDLGCSSEAAG